MEWSTIVGAAVVGFLLGQLSSRLEWARQFRHRWDLDHLRAHANYLAKVDALDALKRREEQANEDLADPTDLLADAGGPRPGDPGFEDYKDAVIEHLRHEREETWKDLAAVKREVESAEAQLELLSDKRMWIAFKGLGIFAGQEGYRDRRKEYVSKVRDDLQIRDWPHLPLWKRMRGKAKRRWRAWRSRQRV